MKTEFIPYEQALELKELGFNGHYIAYYTNDGKLQQGEMWKDKDSIKAPLYQQAFRWFREKYGLYGHIKPENNEDDIIAWEYVILTIVDNFAGVANASEVCFTTRKSNYTTYEKAELACLKKLIEIAKNK